MTRQDLNQFKELRRQQKLYIRRIMFRHMVRDNIADIIPKDMEICDDSWYEAELKIRYKESKDITADVFDKVVAKLSKKLRSNPSLYVSQHSLDATWSFRFNGISVRVCFASNNSEACDVIEKVVERHEYELTGYCKALSEKKYFDN
jgi:hypothetical protein